MNDQEILAAAREILRRHGHGISASCTSACHTEPNNYRAILGPGGHRVDISARRHGAPSLDIWHPCDDDACERQHWLSEGYRYHAAAGVPEPPLVQSNACVPAPPRP